MEKKKSRINEEEEDKTVFTVVRSVDYIKTKFKEKKKTQQKTKN